MSSNIKIIILQKNLELLLIHRNSRDIEDIDVARKKTLGGLRHRLEEQQIKKVNPLSYFP